MATKPAKAKAPATKAPVAVGFAPNTQAANLTQILAAIDQLPKGSDELKKVRNKIYAKIAAKEPNPELVQVFREAVKLHTYDQVRIAWLQVRRENVAKPEAKEESAE